MPELAERSLDHQKCIRCWELRIVDLKNSLSHFTVPSLSFTECQKVCELFDTCRLCIALD